MARNKYVGPSSCYALREGVFVPDRKGYSGREGVNLSTIFSVLALILRDYMRGYSYDSECNKISFGKEDALARIRYLVPLCYRHEDRDICDALKNILLGEDWTEAPRLPEGVPIYLAGERAEQVARELERFGIVSAGQVHVISPTAHSV